MLMEDYTGFAVKLAYEAGKIVKQNFTLGMKKTFKKGDKSPLTLSDTTINQMVIDAVSTRYPTHGVIGEEGTNKKQGRYTWVCDPVDGTIPFSSGIPISTFSLALVEEGKPIMGVVYDPFMDRLFVGKKGMGAYVNDKKIKVSSAKTIKSQILYLGWWKYSTYDLLLVRKELSKKGCKVMDFCSFVYAGALVAAGEFGALIFADRFAWDMAALKVIIEEAGGKCTDIAGNDQRYDVDINGFVAANPAIHAEILETVKKNVIKY